jgi:putative DNA primase/helicase
MACTKAGGLNVQLNKSGFALGQLVGAGLLGEQEVFDALLRAARAAGADDPAKDEDTLRRGIAAGKAEPRKKDDLVIPASASERVPAGEKIIYRASSVVPRAVEWLWPGRVPLGKLTTFAGVKGMGKTFVLCDITARVTRGSDWPGAGGECAAPGQVLFISGEDDPEDTLVPRLIELGADLDRVLFLKTEVKDAFTLADLKTLDRALSEAGPGVRFIAIDPPTAFLGGVDDHKNADLRGVLSPLASWSAKHRAATAFITHVSKPGGMKVEAMMRVMGSVAWVNAVRAAHMFARDPDNPERRLFLPLACNLCEEHKALAYRIAKTDSLARVEWLGEVDTTADEAMNAPRNAPRKVLARDWLIDLFRQKLEWASDDFWASARQHGVSKNAIDEARVQLALPKPRRVCGSSGNVSWVWWVPPDWKHLAQNAAP